ncbi:MAG TPA: 16S rRNA (uracil(1498)-N(3))-methyltransferase [Pyrinomonadaceae bacterium]|nr:16S rRNA (uracil(1498)-N(3))-methyltransferase [Pyrinomonadaceae bacterium]
MGRRRFYAPPGAFNFHSRTVTLEADEARHLREVLRLKPGDEVYVFDGVGKEFHCAIESSRRDTAVLNVLEEAEPARPESPFHLTLAVALLKSDKFDLVVQKATELGVVRLVPVMTRLADIKLKDESDSQKRLGRWRRIALEAAKQSGRAVVPEIAVPVLFSEIIDSQARTDNKVLFSERGGQSLESLSSQVARTDYQMTAMIGSEGGWTDAELEAAKQAGWIVVTLGGRTVRAETAAIAVATLLQHRFGDLN